jgi:hypothetical protein
MAKPTLIQQVREKNQKDTPPAAIYINKPTPLYNYRTKHSLPKNMLKHKNALF